MQTYKRASPGAKKKKKKKKKGIRKESKQFAEHLGIGDRM